MRTLMMRSRLIDAEEFFRLMAPIFSELRRGFEDLLAFGVPQSKIDKLLAILDYGKLGQFNGNGRSHGAARATRATAKKARPD
jgi:hypothetical protein